MRDIWAYRLNDVTRDSRKYSSIDRYDCERVAAWAPLMACVHSYGLAHFFPWDAEMLSRSGNSLLRIIILSQRWVSILNFVSNVPNGDTEAALRIRSNLARRSGSSSIHGHRPVNCAIWFCDTVYASNVIQMPAWVSQSGCLFVYRIRFLE